MFAFFTFTFNLSDGGSNPRFFLKYSNIGLSLRDTEFWIQDRNKEDFKNNKNFYRI